MVEGARAAALERKQEGQRDNLARIQARLRTFEVSAMTVSTRVNKAMIKSSVDMRTSIADCLNTLTMTDSHVCVN